VQKIDADSRQLAVALESGVPIIITTLQKFPFVTEQVRKQMEEERAADARAKGLPPPPPLPDGAAVLPGRRYAVIVDEAHSSQSGESAAEAKGVLGGDHIRAKAKEEAKERGVEGIDHEEEILREMAKRGHQPNISFFAFTATPKHKTIKVFGTPGPDGVPRAFHTYSMKQAIDEGFILNVLENYTTYKAFFGLIKATEEDPEVEKKEAAKALARFLALHPHNIEQKVEVIVEHFRAHTRHKIGGKAKAMVVTSSRLHAVRYKQALDRYVLKMGYPDVTALVAFSGTVEDDVTSSITYTEGSMNNGIADREIPVKFDTEDYRVLIAADKFQTGFDQPLLHTMYVDKRLAGIQAVQTLSRLNRTFPGKADTFVLDFWDQREEVRKAFQDYFEDTRLGEEADPQQLYKLQHELDASGVYRQEEVEGFARIFFARKSSQTPADHAKMHALAAAACKRFVELGDDQRATLPEAEWRERKDALQDEFRSRLHAFVSLFAFLSQVIPYGDSDLTKLYTFARFLGRALPAPRRGPRYDFGDDVALKFYRLEKQSDGSIPLQSGVSGELAGPKAVGTGRSGDQPVELSTLIEELNERFGTDFKPADQLFLDSVREQAVQDEGVKQAALANPLDNFKWVFDKALEGYFIERMEQDADIFNRFMSDKAFQKVVQDRLRQDVWERIRADEQAKGSTTTATAETL
jgi:type I restriction enzyme R subunit